MEHLNQPVIEKAYEEMTRWELWEAMNRVDRGKEMRKIHKCLKKYNDGISFRDRYPYFPIVLSIAALIMQIAALIVKIIGRLCL